MKRREFIAALGGVAGGGAGAAVRRFDADRFLTIRFVVK
jgi:hypothetical protein